MQTVIDSRSLDAGYFGPFRNRFCFAAIGQRLVCSSHPRLRFPRLPSAVSWAIALIVVFPMQCQSIGTWPHVGKEVFETSISDPSSAHRYPATTIVPEGTIMLLKASLLHVLPDAPLPALCQAVRFVGWRFSEFGAPAATRMAGGQIALIDTATSAAVALAEPVSRRRLLSAPPLDAGERQDKPAAEPFADEIAMLLLHGAIVSNADLQARM